MSAELAAAVAQAFAIDGPIARHEKGFVPRQAQDEMAARIAQALDAREALVVEAGTGVGKTFAYLVPLLLSGRRALVSTATKSLQDQLFLRDLPRLRDALGIPVRMALLKGRGSSCAAGVCKTPNTPRICPTALPCARCTAWRSGRNPPAVATLPRLTAWMTGRR